MGKAKAAGARTKAPAGARGGRARPNPNPFEVKVNRQKFQILGRKTRHDVGLPGVSRARAIQKRTQTLLKEYKEREKSNVFTDRRFGEYNSSMSPEEKMLKRFALEQQRQHEKKNIYNLNEDEELTHYGQSLADIEKHNDIVDSDSDTEERGALSAELTAAHFGGGGLLHKKTAQLPGGDGERPKSRRELIEELVAKSKQDKRERQAQREDALELTEKLDQDWKEIQALLAHKAPKSENRDKKGKPEPDAYDMVVRELGFEMKAQPSNRMKTEEELIREEEERLKNLEADRLRRMLGKDEDENTKKPKHVSADDLSDGFILDKDDRRLLSYKDGKMNVEGEQSEAASDGESAEEEGANSSEGDTEGSSGSDGHSDLEPDADSEEESERPKWGQRRAPRNRSTSGDLEAREAARTELPYTFAAPESYEELKSLLSGKSVEEQFLVVERIQKCNHPSLAVGNKAKLEKLFGFLLEYVGDVATDNPPDLRIIDKLVVHLYNLCQMFPESAGDSIKFVLRDAMHEMEGMIEAKGRAAFPGLDVLIYLKIAGMLFPTSDFWHPVVTPTLVCLSQLLTKCPVLSLQDAVKGLFVCCVFLDYVSLSQRFVPELINFLLGILYIATPNKQSQGYIPVHPFRALGKNSELLVVSDEKDTATWQTRSLALLWASGLKAPTETEANHTRLSCLAVCLSLVKHCVLMYATLPSFHDITRPLKALLTEHLAAGSHPCELQELSQSILTEMETHGTHCQPLICEKSKPVPLKMFTPRLVKVLEFGRKQGSTKEEQERKRLIHKHKREFKGAVREIRKDNQFLARMQLSEIMERDAERKRKVKQLFNSLATQEGEWKALKRKKFKK
ncbi:NOP14 nucleolar protein [Rhinolophus ferrumequinum]|uniref:NOP14 nucleolar protein n=1 Tax=Rhinolophus ferrumequinum TaxID=59479 RepID=A0A671EI87_RHIFE|nr:nucleolar protein 14 [Rhinolophus ferrumequinum]KAF6372178.1 NOP14 nucleolar protein [Rhinolophus ferrumequinum]